MLIYGQGDSVEEQKKLKYQFDRLRTMTSKEAKERVAAKMRKRVRLGDLDFESIQAVSKYLKRTHSNVTYYINKGSMPDGTLISFIKSDAK